MSIQPVQSTQTYNPAKKAVKTIAKATIATAAVATTLALGAKKGKFTVTESTNKYAAKVMPYLEEAGNFINSKASKVTQKVATLGIKQKVSDTKAYKTAKKVADRISGEVKKYDIKGKVIQKLNAVKEYVQTNIGKFNPDKAGSADKMAETFNNFVK